MPQCAASRDGRIVTTRTRSRPRNSRWPAAPGRWELPSVGKRLRRLLLRWQAPQPCPRSPRARPHPAQPEAPRRVRQSPAKSPPKPRQSPARDGGPGLAFGLGVTAGRSPCGGPVARKNRGRLAPLGGIGASAFDPSVTRPAVWKPPSAAIDSFSRPAAAWSARNFCAPIGAPPSSMAIPLQPCRGQAQTERHQDVTNGTSHSACCACDDPSVTRVARSAVTNRSARRRVTIR
jgi:hypothetical protein